MNTPAEHTPEPASPGAPGTSAKAEVDLETRIRLSHGLVDHTLQQAGIRALHVKGYAAATIFPPERSSSDVDVVVDPTRTDAALDALQNAGWELVTGYDEGSIFRHAATLWHAHLGYVDVHRHLPGFRARPAEVFEALWDRRTVVDVAHWPCPVAAPLDHVLIIVLHAARNPSRGKQDVDHVLSGLTGAQRATLQRSVRDWGAEDPWLVATGEDLGADPSQVRVWQAVHDDADRATLLSARLHAARTPARKLRVLAAAVVVNRAHLHMALGRAPRRRDYLREYRRRIAAVATHVREGS
ncbi:nucleotidyltransferase family protein [Kocuria soli]|uniref:nucleotidyltransferase family protein n=1 Tax=Kocuria soli TaxID=2485125 RepID=UPI0013158011|nr:nucleotidyltransferase family protein [Kocuria soli]